ncbi:MAG: hypothetical protein P8Y02_07365, partial [Deinococcales bacterium]
MAEAQELGLYTTATMVIGFGETPEQRVASMMRIRDQQDRALATHGNGFSAFISWTLQTQGVRIQGRVPGAGAHEYLQNVAVSRLLLDNVTNFQASWPTMGYKVAQTALSFGCNDFGSTMLEENVVSQAGARHRSTPEREIVRQIVDAGYRPAQRDSLYGIVRHPDVEALLAIDDGAARADWGFSPPRVGQRIIGIPHPSHPRSLSQLMAAPAQRRGSGVVRDTFRESEFDLYSGKLLFSHMISEMMPGSSAPSR